MRKESLLSGYIIILLSMTLLVSSFEWKHNDKSSVHTESRGQNRKVYNAQLIRKNKKYEIKNSVSSPLIIKEKELVSIYSTEIKITYVYSFSKDEIEILERITEAEAEGQDSDSKKNVCSNIINRMESKSFPDTIKEVVFQKNQYSSTTDGRYKKVEISKDTKEAVNDVLRDGATHDCLYFFSLKDIKSQKIKNWINNSLDFQFKDSSGHAYYKEK